MNYGQHKSLAQRRTCKDSAVDTHDRHPSGKILNQEVLLDWTLITTSRDLQRAAESIGTSRRSYDEFPTAFGEALTVVGRADMTQGVYSYAGSSPACFGVDAMIDTACGPVRAGSIR